VPDRRGSLTVVGTGIDVATQLTPGARAAIEAADVVLYLLADAVGALRIEALNPQARSLDGFYAPNKERTATYAQIVEAILSEAISGANVCAAFYGHPGVYAAPGHEAVRRGEAAGLPARMLPAVSALDCLFADLGIDPGRGGLQAYEATSFFEKRPPVDPNATLLLLQVGMLGERGGSPTAAVVDRFAQLVELLRRQYDAEREAVLYEASAYPGVAPKLMRFRLGDPNPPTPSVLATLCVSVQPVGLGG
jgi:uroporphyrin-III C-methyltransferase